MASAIKCGTIRQYTAVRKPIYIAEITAYRKDFALPYDVVEEFKKRKPDFAECKYDYESRNEFFVIRLYRECAIDFI